MRKIVDKILEIGYLENTLAGSALVALFFLFFRIASYFVNLEVFSKVDKWLSDLLVPYFMMIVLIEIYDIRKRVLNQVETMKTRSENELLLQTFSTGEEFYDYLRHRFNRAHEVRVIHLSSSVSGREASPVYWEILDKFVRKNRTFMRILANTDNKEAFRWIKEDLQAYEQHKYFISVADRIKVDDDIRTTGIMIIDAKEVCLGAWYATGSKNPTISIVNETIVQFFSDYFQYLWDASKKVKIGGSKADLDYLDKLISGDAPVKKGRASRT